MNILFVSIRTRGRDLVEEPGIASIAAYIKSKNDSINCKVVQLYANDKELYEAIINLKEFNPKIIAFPLYDDYFDIQIGIVEKFKSIFNDSCIFIGGYSSTYHGHEIMKRYPFIDVCMVGEGEISMLELVNTIQQNNYDYSSINGIIYREGDALITTDRCLLINDLNMLPFTNRDILEKSNYNLAQISTSRGCIGICTFCCSSNFWRDAKNHRKYRLMTVGRIVDEIEYVVNKYNKTRFVFNDNSYEDPDNNTQRQLDIANEIIKRNIKISYNVNYKTGFYRYATKDFMDRMIESGLSSIFLGIEAFNDEDLNVYKKRTTLADNENALNYFGSFEGLGVSIGFININPYSTIERLQQNIQYLYKFGYANDLSNFISKLRVYKGTDLYSRTQNDGLLYGNLFDRGYRYDYVDRRILELDDFIFSIDPKLVHDSGFYSDRFKNIIKYLKRWCFDANDLKAYELISATEAEYEKILNKLNDTNYLFFSNILDLAQQQWDIVEANITMDKFMPDIRESVSALHKKRNSLFANLIHMNKTYKDLF